MELAIARREVQRRLRKFKIGRSSEGETEERVVVVHDRVFGCAIGAAEPELLIEEAGRDRAGFEPGPRSASAGRRGIVARGSLRVGTQDRRARGGEGDHHDTGDGREEVFETGEVTGANGPVDGEHAIIDVDKGEDPHTGAEEGLQRGSELAVGESQSRVVAGVEEFRDVIEQLGGEVDQLHGVGEDYYRVVWSGGGRKEGGESGGI